MYDRAVLHMDLDSFFVSVECLKNSDLLGKPLIIGGDGGEESYRHVVMRRENMASILLCR
jgi:nucleotidyltransferase/DNA polymerase involved in DNA repair